VPEPRDEVKGLSSSEAYNRLLRYGANELIATQRLSLLRQLLSLFANPLVIILLLASLVSGFVGETVNAFIIVIIVLLSITLNFIQSYRSQQAAEALKAHVAPAATVLRDDQWKEIARREIVPGDIIQLSAGDLVPADARLLQARDLHVNQAALTGKSLPVEKEALKPNSLPSSPEHAHNIVFLGTSIVSGTATVLVTATGAATAFGDIAIRLAAHPPETEFEHGIRQFSMLIMKTVFFLVLFVLLVNIILQRNPLEPILFALALAVGLTPEFLPMIMAVTLGQGAVRMAHQKVIVKHLAAIQNFGSMYILCSDKTGTLTSGEMVLEKYYDPFGNATERVLRLAYLNSFHETGIKNPLDVVIIKHAKIEIESSHKLDEIPFDFERRRLSIVVKDHEQCLMITKGAPESVLSCCVEYEIAGQQLSLDGQALAKCNATWRNVSEPGYRGVFSHRLVYRISCHTDIGVIYYSHRGQPLT
jgi:Mg2+-importing ATPase